MHLIISLTFLGVLMIVLIFLSGWFSGSETALTNLTNAQIAEMRRKKEKNVEYIYKLKKDMDRTIVAILIGNNIVNIILASVSALIANALFHELGVTIMVVLITFLIILFGEITPKSDAIWDSKRISQKKSRPIYYLMRALNPVISMFIFLSSKIIKLTAGEKRETNLLVTDESIKSLATLGEQEGVIKRIEREIIHKVFLFGDRKIKEIMVPMEKVFYLDKNHSVEEAKEILKEHGFTRVPVMNEKKSVKGLLYTKDLLGIKKGQIDSLLRIPFTVSSKSDVTDVFNRMKEKRVHMAIVKDIKNNHIGIVTLEDILEELVGEIYDEYFDVKYKSIVTAFKKAEPVTT